MNHNESNFSSRRDFIKTTGKVAAVSALAGLVIPHVHAAENNTIQVALVGCGGRGTGAADNALSVKNGPLKLVAMADVFDGKLKGSYETLSKQHGEKVDVPEDRRFVGFDGYKKAMDCLKPGDIVIFTTPPAFRWVHFTYAIQKGLNVFMEKPVTVDGPTSKKMLQLAEEAKKKNLKVGVGLMCRHCKVRQELFDRIKGGEIGDIVTLQAYRMHAPVAACFTPPKPGDISELLYQIRDFHSFLWASGGLYSDFYIHNIDECCWMKDAWPVKAQALGGRNYRGGDVDQNFDVYSVEYTFGDGTKLFLNGRAMEGCHEEFASHALGTKGSAIISTQSHTPARSRIYKGYDLKGSKPTWTYPGKEPNPYQVEWEDLVDAIRNDKPYNEVKRGVEASLVTSMGRMAAHTGQVVTFDEILNSGHEFAPTVDQLAMNSPAPLQADKDGRYPIPMPGIKKDREY
ncbi:Gfo/Idh/MocA family oxidoreductase [Pedosphaera parvula]|uniref:Oxidoreductase domain protein n=1 Tax=Pedosphaera parvula (strain Ellin514) TaxID=320771 RepID=B9XG32_PEDPL|nr:Gfo/Idh/MocA family oxidoreductase [Pedosphaera parvula]EEF61194.1 oxidoreductase domain protein [Pedosphaera parvula Ellin514]